MLLLHGKQADKLHCRPGSPSTNLYAAIQHWCAGELGVSASTPASRRKDGGQRSGIGATLRFAGAADMGNKHGGVNHKLLSCNNAKLSRTTLTPLAIIPEAAKSGHMDPASPRKKERLVHRHRVCRDRPWRRTWRSRWPRGIEGRQGTSGMRSGLLFRSFCISNQSSQLEEMWSCSPSSNLREASQSFC